MGNSNEPVADSASWWQAALMIRGQTPTEDRNIRAVWLWCGVWAISFIIASGAIKSLQLQGRLAWLLAMVPIALSFPALYANWRFLRQADEFMRKVQLEGIALGFSAAFVFCLGYFMLEHLVGAPRLSMIFAVVPMAFGWAVGSLLVAARFR
jgi:hypothetical protein